MEVGLRAGERVWARSVEHDDFAPVAQEHRLPIALGELHAEVRVALHGAVHGPPERSLVDHVPHADGKADHPRVRARGGVQLTHLGEERHLFGQAIKLGSCHLASFEPHGHNYTSSVAMVRSVIASA